MSGIDVAKLIEHFNEIVEAYKKTNSNYKFGALIGIYNSYTILFGTDHNSDYMEKVIKEL